MSDRRHELQQNELAVYLNRINHAIEPYSRLIAIAVGGLIIAAIAVGFYNAQASGRRSDATLELIQATGSSDTEVLKGVEEKFPGTIAAQWARLYQGNQLLAEGIQALFTNRDIAQEKLTDSQAAFRAALATSDDVLLRSRAHWGLARASESLGNLDEAITEYREIVAIGESEAMIEKAEDRIATLSNPETKDFMAWFADQNFTPADPSLPPALPGGEALPDLPDLELPDLDLPGGENSAVMELEDTLEMPAEGDQPTDTEASGNDTTSDEPESEADPAEDESAPQPPPGSEEPAASEAPAADEQPVTESDDTGDQ